MWILTTINMKNKTNTQTKRKGRYDFGHSSSHVVGTFNAIFVSEIAERCTKLKEFNVQTQPWSWKRRLLSLSSSRIYPLSKLSPTLESASSQNFAQHFAIALHLALALLLAIAVMIRSLCEVLKLVQNSLFSLNCLFLCF